MRVALAQIDTVVGDIVGNTERVVKALEAGRAAGARLTLVPELALTGYPPEDLLARPHFVEDNLDALERVAAASGGTAVVGFVDRDSAGALHNAAALIGDYRVIGVYHKRRLPNYGVFDERRYFTPGDLEAVFDLDGSKYDVTVCEDVWAPELVAEDAERGAEVVLNISASPFYAGKGAEREAMLAQRARDNGVWLAYCNLVGGQDELVFDGRSVVVSPAGEIVARAKAFEEDLLVCDLGGEVRVGAPRIEPALSGAEEAYAALELGLRDYVRKNDFSDVVIGLSGGIDSALTAALAADALGNGHVHGVLMPSRYSSEGSLTDARALADSLGVNTLEVPIEGPLRAFEESLAPAFAGVAADVTEENIQARVRGTLVMALSNKFGWLVLATGNKSELSVGYSTLYGDMVGGFAPIKDVFKTRVYELARWRNATGGPVIPDATLVKPPSAELREDQRDSDALPPYETLDPILERYVERDMSREAITEDDFDPDVVERVCDMVDQAEYKRRQGPVGIKITPKAFGKDRRVPITNRYRG